MAKKGLIDSEENIFRAAQKLRVVRDALGGHVRLANARPGKLAKRSRFASLVSKVALWRRDDPKPNEGDEFERAALEQFADWKGPALIDPETGWTTTFRGLTLTAVFQATATDTPEKLVAWHENLALLRACGDAMHAIDFLIVTKLSIRAESAGRSSAAGITA